MKGLEDPVLTVSLCLVMQVVLNKMQRTAGRLVAFNIWIKQFRHFPSRCICLSPHHAQTWITVDFVHILCS